LKPPVGGDGAEITGSDITLHKRGFTHRVYDPKKKREDSVVKMV